MPTQLKYSTSVGKNTDVALIVRADQTDSLPELSSDEAAYLKRQYHNFQLGVRGAHADDKYGRQMKMMSTSLPTDKDLDDVIAYIQSLAGSR